MTHPPQFDKQIHSYYDRFDEEGRLTKPGELDEFARMQELLERFLPAPPTTVMDVGGGPGAYSCLLARKGYEVHLIDPMGKHIDQARKASASQPTHPVASISKGDARVLDRSDGSVDVVLLMGPLYHLTSREDRIKALDEAHRVLRPGGLVLAKAMNRFASLFQGLVLGFIDDPDFVTILDRDLREGQHRGAKDKYFTTAYFHLPDELESELREASFTIKELVAVQGPALFTKDLNERWEDSSKRTELLRLIRAVESERTLLGVSTHFVVLGQK